MFLLKKNRKLIFELSLILPSCLVVCVKQKKMMCLHSKVVSPLKE